MPAYLLDTNIVLRLVNPKAANHDVVKAAISKLREHNQYCVLTPQVLIEFWAVATRPTTANGFGWDALTTRAEIDRLLDLFPLLEDTPVIFDTWLTLVTTFAVRGKRVHDLRLIAVMQAHKVTHLLTFNTGDFPATPDVTLVHPEQVR
jgi:predicted nucleic acid-binding protein